MPYLSLAWSILVNLVACAVILAMFQITRSPFETVVVSSLVLIYVSVIGSRLSLSYALSRKWNIDLLRYISIAQALRISTEIEKEALNENADDDRKGQPLFWTAVAFNSLFALIALWHLLLAIKSLGI